MDESNTDPCSSSYSRRHFFDQLIDHKRAPCNDDDDDDDDDFDIIININISILLSLF